MHYIIVEGFEWFSSILNQCWNIVLGYISAAAWIVQWLYSLKSAGILSRVNLWSFMQRRVEEIGLTNQSRKRRKFCLEIQKGEDSTHCWLSCQCLLATVGSVGRCYWKWKQSFVSFFKTFLLVGLTDHGS
jgi:hypothetical protein